MQEQNQVDSRVDSSRRDKPSSRRLRPQTVALLAIAVVFGLLLWAKLLLVTGHPRTALADPEQEPDGATVELRGASSASAAD